MTQPEPYKSPYADEPYNARRAIQIEEAKRIGLRTGYDYEKYMLDEDERQGLITYEEYEKRLDDLEIRHFGQVSNSPSDILAGNLMMIALFAFAIWFFFDVFIFRGD